MAKIQFDNLENNAQISVNSITEIVKLSDEDLKSVVGGDIFEDYKTLNEEAILASVALPMYL